MNIASELQLFNLNEWCEIHKVRVDIIYDRYSETSVGKESTSFARIFNAFKNEPYFDEIVDLSLYKRMLDCDKKADVAIYKFCDTNVLKQFLKGDRKLGEENDVKVLMSELGLTWARPNYVVKDIELKAIVLHAYTENYLANKQKHQDDGVTIKDIKMIFEKLNINLGRTQTEKLFSDGVIRSTVGIATEKEQSVKRTWHEKKAGRPANYTTRNDFLDYLKKAYEFQGNVIEQIYEIELAEQRSNDKNIQSTLRAIRKELAKPFGEKLFPHL
ncbi:hypothetical protein [Paenibacillus campi]|uniref:hypothetical protein n=1 Tax=Paenibacillus campi TaxID=3106031 RepID=UPI002AFE949B|nr:hypothetical protein [Paenibacillus sp. SGZ-1014]